MANDDELAPLFQSLLQVEVAAATHPGKVRKNNEDHFLVGRLGRSLDLLEYESARGRSAPTLRGIGVVLRRRRRHGWGGGGGGGEPDRDRGWPVPPSRPADLVPRRRFERRRQGAGADARPDRSRSGRRPAGRSQRPQPRRHGHHAHRRLRDRIEPLPRARRRLARLPLPARPVHPADPRSDAGAAARRPGQHRSRGRRQTPPSPRARPRDRHGEWRAAGG